MLTQKECQTIINKSLKGIQLPDLPSHLYEPIGYMLGLEGKRLRPSLVLIGCNVFSDKVEFAITAALAIEVFHNFTLMHDDIMDNSSIRRNHPTVHIKWNRNIGLLSGDAMLIKAFELLATLPKVSLERVLPIFCQTALKVCEGQQYDMDYEQNQTVSIDDYIRMVELKTAVLLAASLKIGAILGDANEKESDYLYEFGRNLGIAFQLQDDLLDVFADSTITGKEIGNDIVANKKTILLTEALNTASGENRTNLLDWLSRVDFDKKQKIEAVKKIFTILKIEQSVKKRIAFYHEKAVSKIRNLDVTESRKSELLNFSEFLMKRKK